MSRTTPCAAIPIARILCEELCVSFPSNFFFRFSSRLILNASAVFLFFCISEKLLPVTATVYICLLLSRHMLFWNHRRQAVYFHLPNWNWAFEVWNNDNVFSQLFCIIHLRQNGWCWITIIITQTMRQGRGFVMEVKCRKILNLWPVGQISVRVHVTWRENKL